MSQIFLDTNIFARYLVGDIAPQKLEAKEIFDSIYQGKNTGVVSILVIDELIWVLENYYNYERKDYLPKVIKLFSFKEIRVLEIKKEIIMDIFESMLESKVDFTDYYLMKVSKGRKIVSFDKDFGKLFGK